MRSTDFLMTSGAAWLPLADAVLKATLVFAAAGATCALLRRTSAAARHLVWTLALVSAMALPVLSLALPRWQIPLVTITPSAASPAESPVAREIVADSGLAAPALGKRPVQQATVPQAGANVPRATAAPAASPRTARLPFSFSLSNVPWPGVLLTVWALGAALVLLRLVTGLVGVQWLSRRTERVATAPWLPLARALAAELGLSRRLVFLRSRRAAMPMAWGILRPAVLMPRDADSWPHERLRIVLLHELAHVKRRDCLTHALAQISCALYWFNPLVWMAARHLRTERERACDDLVLAAGTRGPDYAEQLLDIARVTRAGRFPGILAGASLAMAQRSELEGRLMAILDPAVPRSGISRLRTVAASSLFAFGLMPLASVQPWGFAAPDDSPAVQNAAASQPVPPVGRPTPVVPPAATPAVPATPQPAAPPVQPAPVTKENRVTPRPAVPARVAESAVEAALASVQDSIPTIVNSVIAAVAPVPRRQANSSPAPVVAGAGARADRRNARPADPRTVAALTAALKDSDEDVRQMALHALVQMRDPSIFEPLVQALSDAVADVRQQAAAGLGQMRDKRAVEPLIRALKDADGDVREQAAFALAQLRDRTAVAALAQVLKDADEDVRQQAVFALGQLRDPAAVDALTAAAHDSKPDVREQAVFALGQIRDARAVAPLISALKDAAPDVREQAAFALGQIRDHAAVEALVIALKDAVPDVREQVAFALGQIGDERAIDGLTAALKDVNADVREQAAFALGQLAR